MPTMREDLSGVRSAFLRPRSDVALDSALRLRMVCRTGFRATDLPRASFLDVIPPIVNHADYFINPPWLFRRLARLSGHEHKYDDVRGKGFFGQTRRERRAYPAVDL